MKSYKSISRIIFFDQIPFFAISKTAKNYFLNWENYQKCNFTKKNLIFCLAEPQRARKFKKVQAKKLVKSNKSIFSWNCIFSSFPSSKIDFWPFLKLQKMEFGQKKNSEIDLFDFTIVFGLDFFKFSGPLLCVAELGIIIWNNLWNRFRIPEYFQILLHYLLGLLEKKEEELRTHSHHEKKKACFCPISHYEGAQNSVNTRRAWEAIILM